MPQSEQMPSKNGARAIIVMGVSGCGKSSIAKHLAEELGWHFFEGDALHPEGNIAKMRKGVPLTDDDRLPWLDKIADEVSLAIDQGQNITASCSALKRIYRQRLRDRLGPKLNFIFLNVSYEALRDRMDQRKNHFMPTSLLQTQLDVLEVPLDEADVYEINGELSQKAIVDQILSLITPLRIP